VIVAWTILVSTLTHTKKNLLALILIFRWFIDMRRDVQAIFRKTPHVKQVMMFSATLSDEVRPVCKKFMRNPLEIIVNDSSKLTLHGLQQYYVRVVEKHKVKKLFNILDSVEFNQVVVFTKKTERADYLCRLLKDGNFPAIVIHGRLTQPERYISFYFFNFLSKNLLGSVSHFLYDLLELLDLRKLRTFNKDFL